MPDYLFNALVILYGLTGIGLYPAYRASRGSMGGALYLAAFPVHGIVFLIGESILKKSREERPPKPKYPDPFQKVWRWLFWPKGADINVPIQPAESDGLTVIFVIFVVIAILWGLLGK